MGLLLFYILLALGVSFMCSVMEAVLLSITPSFVAMQEEKNQAVGKQLKALKEDVDQPLAAILSLNTIAHTIGAAGAGAQAAIVFKSVPVAVFSVVLTLLILVLSEIIPKTIGALYWKSLAPSVARMLQPLIMLMYPLVKVSQMITALLSGGKKSTGVSRAELSAIAVMGEKQGVLEETESQLLQNILRFRTLHAKDVMTPRPVMFALQQDTTVGAVVETHPNLRFSRIPIYKELRDDIDSYVLKDELLLHVAQDKHDTPLHEIKRSFAVVPAEKQLLSLFDTLLQNAEHIALVVGEYGGVSGIVTMEDIIETMLGMEIVDELDSIEDMQDYARKRWRERAKKLGIIDDSHIDAPLTAQQEALQEQAAADDETKD